MPPKTKIILDTNFLLIPSQFKVDIFSEIKRICDFSYELCVMKGSIDELEKIQKDKKQKGRNKSAAKLGLAILKKKKYKILSSKIKDVDKAIIDYSKKHKGSCLVATQDIGLKKSLKTMGIVIILLRSRKFLKLD